MMLKERNGMKRLNTSIPTIALTSIALALALTGTLCVGQDTQAAPANGATTTTQQNTAQPNAAQSMQPTQQVPESGAPQAGVPQPSAAGPQTPRLAAGSVIPIQLTKGIDAKKAKTGDEVEGRVTLDLKAQNGTVIVPKDTKVMGHVTEAQAHTKDQKESQIGITFDHAVMKDGHDISVPASIQAIISPEALNANNNNSTSASSDAASSDSSSSQSASSRPGPGGGMSNNRPASPSSTTSTPDNAGSSSSAAANHPNQPITGNTQGVVGIADVQLSAATAGTQGSVVSSEKKNVKLDSGTLMLLRVNP
jgi:hypothetical protein